METIKTENIIIRPDTLISPEDNINDISIKKEINMPLPVYSNMLNVTNPNQSFLNKSSMYTYSKIICCICQAVIDANPKGMCITCVRSESNITEGISKFMNITYCKGCDRYQRPPWVRCPMESPEMMSFLLAKVKGLGKVKLIDSSFIWTEPHSKIIKLKLTVQKEMIKILVESSFVVEIVVEWTQCEECKKTFTPHLWNSSVQIRQKVSHKRTFMLLEQIILKNKAHLHSINCEEVPDGVDFMFKNKSHAATFSDFIQIILPCLKKESKQLISHDQHSNTFNYKFSFMLEIAPVCKDDLIILDKEICKELGGIGPVLLCHKISSKIHLIDPLSFMEYEFDGNSYWRHGFKSYVDRDCLEEFMIIGVEEETNYHEKYSKENMSIPDIEDSGSKLNQSKSTNYKNNQTNLSKQQARSKKNKKIVTVQCIYNKKQSNGHVELMTVRSHLGKHIHPGDIFLGYDMNSLNVNETLESIMSQADKIPDIILVKKKYVKSENSKRLWKLKHLDKEHEIEKNIAGKKRDKILETKAKQYEEFLEDIEQDRKFRDKYVNLYKDESAIKENADKYEVTNDENEVKVEELLEDLEIMDKHDDIIEDEILG